MKQTSSFKSLSKVP